MKRQLRRMKRLLIVLPSLAALATGAHAGSASGPAPWAPQKPITWVVTYSPGGGFDTYARAIAPIMSKYLGVDIVVRNIPGAGGRTGINHLYRAQPDGHTIGIINVAGAITSQMVMKTHYDLTKLTWLGQCATDINTQFVAGDSSFHAIEDLRKAAAKIPIRAVSIGPGSTDYVCNIIGLTAMDIPFTFVQGYKGSSEMMLGVMRGDGETGNNSLTSTVPFLESERLRALAVFADNRNELAPQVPSSTELGYPELAAIEFSRAIAAPPETPASCAAVLADALWKALHDPDLTDWGKKSKRSLNPRTAQETENAVLGLFRTFAKYKHIISAYYK